MENQEELSRALTTITRLRNLLEERGIELPPEIEESIEDQLETYDRYLAYLQNVELRKLREQKEDLGSALEIIEEKYGADSPDVRRAFRKAQNTIEKEIQEIETREPEDMMADPDWI